MRAANIIFILPESTTEMQTKSNTSLSV